ncbi:hypothetical protein [Confluentibacter flavum]|uniref:Uncharacterized protein n=1 Tax=Confluentibacter flavum TaxID=1909700 RepID=A0A2N3HM80_9FLAO|nr:hypothetical protein [Confluentibacter flavum]PKQ46069.1 hypothetical protein CSW08_04830 [Confluentibacter flavum]
MKRNKSILEMTQEHFMIKTKTEQIIKNIKIGTIVVGSVYAFGIACRILNFSMRHFKNLKNTLRN